MLTVYVVPEDLIDADWLPTARSLALLNLSNAVSEMFYFGDTFGDQEESEERVLQDLSKTPLAHLVPAVEGRILPAPAAAKIENDQLVKLLSALCDGPWKLHFDVDLGLFDNLYAAIEQALQEGSGLLIVRSRV